MRVRDYVPGQAARYDLFFKNLIQYVNAKCAGQSPAWTHIPSAALTALSGVYADWYTAYAITLKPCTSQEKAEKRRLQVSSAKALRAFVNAYLRFHPDVTDEDRENMGLPVSDGTRTPVVAPEEGPDYEILQFGNGRLGIVYRNGSKGRKGSKPPGVTCARIYYGVFDSPVTGQEQLPASVRATRCPHSITFREGDRGARAYFALKWEIQKGNNKERSESNWSEIQSEIIP
jgi:hypothetical protein